MDAPIEDYPPPDVEVHPTAVLEEGARIGERCVLGKSVFVDSGAVIGSGCHIQNSVSVYSGVNLEEDVFVGPAAVFTNDRFPRAARGDWKLLRTFVRRGASIGANATILSGVTIGGWAVVAAGGMVTKDVGPHRLVVG